MCFIKGLEAFALLAALLLGGVKVVALLARRIGRQLIAWASDDVLIEWSRFKRFIASASTEAETEAAPFEFERLLIAIRRDYGHKGQAVEEGDLLGLFITDV
ncbi:hypothetical protein [Streptomyces sp. SPB074]|uniref:hypothetical protein n=1 Tax=Streptomyces sp. (strain SPB074) TaxID=465543 RepID=UPI00017F14AB|nr:hypothetical protein [Streptomyces sp. SPB074]EDY46816.1 hypothetical protein SSBG_04779 [Streptomyces sp. SPB074]